MKNKKIVTELSRTREIMGLINEQSNLDAGDYHMWSSCAGGGTFALFSNQVNTASGAQCHNAANQGVPGLVLACNQALVTAFGTGPVLKWGIGNQQKSCWEYQGTQYYNSIPPISSPGQGGNFPTPQTLASCSQCSGQGDLAWMCTDVGGGAGGTGCQAVTCPYPTIQNMPGKCWDNQQDCNNGGLNPSLNAQPCGGYDGIDEYECNNGTCIQWQGGSFTGPTALADCQSVCGSGGGNYECTTNGCVPNSTGQYSSLVQCQTLCPAGNPHTCNNGNCVADPLGNFPTLNDCQQNCSQTQTLDCDTGAPMYTPQQWAGNLTFYATADQKSLDAQNGGNGCNWICNKRNSLQSQAPFTPGSLGQDRKQCKLDYINDIYNNTPCQPNPQGSGCIYGAGVQVSPNWVNLMTNRYNSTSGPGGCWGISGNNNQSVCGRKNHFCVSPGPTTPMKQAKCDWLTDFINNQTNCGC